MSDPSTLRAIDFVRRQHMSARLAATLFELSTKSKDNSNERFVLLRKTMELAGDGGDAALMMKAVEAIGADFEIDVLDVKQKALESFGEGATSSAAIKSLVESSEGVIDQAVAEGRYELALNLANLVHQACMKPTGREFRKEAYDRRREVEALYAAWKEFQEALATHTHSRGHASSVVTPQTAASAALYHRHATRLARSLRSRRQCSSREHSCVRIR